MRRPAMITLPLLLGAGYPAGADMIDTDSMAPWEQCGFCHGIDGISATQRFPHLAGQPAAYIEKQLNDFRTGRRTNDSGMMQAIAGSLSPADVATVADYFSRQTPPAGAANDKAAEARSTGFLRPLSSGDCEMPACAACHGEDGRGDAEAAVPRLAGQHAGYLLKQLNDFIAGDRVHHQPAAGPDMNTIARCLSAAQRGRLSRFAARLEAPEN